MNIKGKNEIILLVGDRNGGCLKGGGGIVKIMLLMS